MRKKPPVRYKTRAQERRAIHQRAENLRAKREERPMPYPNIWDVLDPTKVGPDATPEEIHQSYLEFCKLCPPPKRIEYIL